MKAKEVLIFHCDAALTGISIANSLNLDWKRVDDFLFLSSYENYSLIKIDWCTTEQQSRALACLYDLLDPSSKVLFIGDKNSHFTTLLSLLLQVKGIEFTCKSVDGKRPPIPLI